MNLIAIDTSTSVAGVCALSGDHLAVREARVPSAHSKAVLPLVREVLEELGLRIDDVDRVAVALGPGLFTSLRIGVSTANGLAWSLGVPSVGISTLAALAWHARAAHAVTTVLDARRGEVFASRFRFDDAQPTSCGVERFLPAHEVLVDVAQDGDRIVLGGGAERDSERYAHDRFDGVVAVTGSSVEAVARLAAGATPATDTRRWPSARYLRRPLSSATPL